MWNGASAAVTSSPVNVVCDTGPILHLDELDSLDLLSDFQKVILPSCVHGEIRSTRPSLLESSDIRFTICKATLQTDDALSTVCRIFFLGPGETEALAIMRGESTATFLTDDAAARLVAEQMGFKVHGTIGILIRSIRRGLREPTEVVSILSQIPARSTLYIKRALLDDIVLQVKTEFGV